MGDSIHLSRNLINQLVDDEVKSKKKAKKTKPKPPKETQQSQKKLHQKPIPIESDIQKGTPTPRPSSSSELEAIRSLLKESESVLEKLQRIEENMSQEVTQRAKELYECLFGMLQGTCKGSA